MPQYVMPDSNEPDFRALDDFTRGYIQALFWLSEASGVTTEQWQATEDHAEGSIPGDVGFSDLASQALAKIEADCARFQNTCKALLAAAYERDYSEERAGHDFWLTRNGHGTGFWDRKELEYEPAGRRGLSLGTLLTNAAKRFGEVDVYLGDDGKVYL